MELQTESNLKRWVGMLSDNAIKLDGWDNAIIGVAEREELIVLIYSQERIIAGLQDMMNEEDAVEYFEYNIRGLWAGPGTPYIVGDY